MRKTKCYANIVLKLKNLIHLRKEIQTTELQHWIGTASYQAISYSHFTLSRFVFSNAYT